MGWLGLCGWFCASEVAGVAGRPRAFLAEEGIELAQVAEATEMGSQ